MKIKSTLFKSAYLVVKREDHCSRVGKRGWVTLSREEMLNREGTLCRGERGRRGIALASLVTWRDDYFDGKKVILIILANRGFVLGNFQDQDQDQDSESGSWIAS
jgi:hypothetical protein